MDDLRGIVAAIDRAKAALEAAGTGVSSAGEQLVSCRDAAHASAADGLTGRLDLMHQRSEDIVVRAATAGGMADRITANVNAIIAGTGSSTVGTPSIPAQARGEEPSPHTRPSFAPDHRRLPGGTPKHTHPTSRDDRGHRRENEAAIVLARVGYDVIQAPGRKANNKDPDYLIEGRPWDCYAPTTSKVDRVRNNVSTKVKDQQASRIILDLSDSTVTTSGLRNRLRTKPIDGLDEIKVIDNDRVIDFYPDPGRAATLWPSSTYSRPLPTCPHVRSSSTSRSV